MKLKKFCPTCKKTKSSSQFYQHKSRHDGLHWCCKPCQSIHMRKYRLKREYGITVEEYDNMLQKQGGGCGLCSSDKGSLTTGCNSVFHVDHNHETGQVRALLCGKCNKALGLLNDDPELMRRAANYVEKYNASG